MGARLWRAAVGLCGLVAAHAGAGGKSSGEGGDVVSMHRTLPLPSTEGERVGGRTPRRLDSLLLGRKQRLLDSAEGRSAPPEVPSTSVASSSPLPVVMPTAVAEAAAGMATMDISDAPPALTAEERKQRILDQLHPPSKKLTASAALDAEMTETVKTIAERSGMDAVAIAAMLSLDVDAVRAVLAAP